MTHVTHDLPVKIIAYRLLHNCCINSRHAAAHNWLPQYKSHMFYRFTANSYWNSSWNL